MAGAPDADADTMPSAPESTFLPARSQRPIAAMAGVAIAAMALWYCLRGPLVHHDAAAATSVAFLVDLNAADAVELAQLPGLGPATAARIVEHRRTHGPFASPDALLEVPGIGPATLAALRPHLQPLAAATEPMP